MTPSTEDARIYEVAVLYPYPLNQKDESKLLKDVEGILADAGGMQVAKDLWGRRGLAYKVKGFSEGSFAIYHYELDPLKLSEVDEALRILPGMLRHMIVKPPKNYAVVKYSETYVEWQKERESVEDLRTKEREEKIQKQVADKAKRQAKRATTDKKPVEAAPSAPAAPGAIEAELDKIIGSDSLDL